MMEHRSSGSIISAVVTGFVAIVPAEALDYLGKLFSVFVLAIVAELGRRAVSSLLKGKKQ